MEVSLRTVKRVDHKVYLPEVRKVSWGSGEMCEFTACLVSAMECLGEEVPYAFVMGTSGVAFRFTLSPGEWEFGNYSILNISPDPYEPIRRAFTAAGYAYTILTPGSLQEDSSRIMDSLERGVPVLAFRVVGPSDCVIITGYDEGGEVLLGWSSYQDIPDDHNIPHDETGYFRKPGWHEHLPGYILIGEKVERPPLRAVYLEALKWAVYLMHTPQMGKNATGLSGLQVWSDEMTEDKYFPAGNDELIGWRYVSVAINMTMLRDHCLAEPFLRQAILDVPEFHPELSKAADCYLEVVRIRNGMDALIADNFSEPAMQAIYDPEIRRQYAQAILRIRDVEAEAVGHIERLLERSGIY
jgi:hypothetical protein